MSCFKFARAVYRQITICFDCGRFAVHSHFDIYTCLLVCCVEYLNGVLDIIVKNESPIN